MSTRMDHDSVTVTNPSPDRTMMIARDLHGPLELARAAADARSLTDFDDAVEEIGRYLQRMYAADVLEVVHQVRDDQIVDVVALHRAELDGLNRATIVRPLYDAMAAHVHRCGIEEGSVTAWMTLAENRRAAARRATTRGER